MRALVRTLAAALVLASVSACAAQRGREVTGTTSRPDTSFGSYVDVDGVPVLDGGVQRPGTSFGDGFVVAEGSMLLGSTFATGPQIELNGRSIPNDGWEAVILVTGDVERVLTE